MTRVVNLFRRSGLSPDDFCQKLYAAGAQVTERTAAIKATTIEPGQRFPTKRKMGYFLAVLEGQMGLQAAVSSRFCRKHRIGVLPSGPTQRKLTPYSPRYIG